MLNMEAVEKFVEEQRRAASGQRLVLLQRNMTGEKKMLGTILLPVLKSFDGLILEYEIVSTTGAKIYIDAFYEPLRIAFESDGFVTHAETITRDRFDFERMRIRTFGLYPYKYVPFTWDEMDKKPEACRRMVYELLGRFSGTNDLAYKELSVYEREVIRYALRLNRPFKNEDVCYCLNMKRAASIRVLQSMLGKKLIRPVSGGSQRNHLYVLEENAVNYMLY